MKHGIVFVLLICTNALHAFGADWKAIVGLPVLVPTQLINIEVENNRFLSLFLIF